MIEERSEFFGVPNLCKCDVLILQVRMYRWQFGEFDNVMDESLDIAMDYLIRTGQAVKFGETQDCAAYAIACAWRAGIRSRLKLSNLAIRAVEKAKQGRTVSDYDNS